MLKLPYGEIRSAGGRDLRLFEKPAIYAWYRSLDFQRYASDPELLEDMILQQLDTTLSQVFEGNIGFLYRLQVKEKPSGLSETKRANLKKVLSNEHLKTNFLNLLDQIEDMQAPLYIGKALDLKQRIGQHIDLQTSLLETFEKSGIDVERCFIKFQYLKPDALLDDLKDAALTDDNYVTLAEDIITRLSPAAFVRRPG